MSGGSIVPIPKDWPNFGESNSDYRKRIWAKHQSRISEKVASGGSGQLLDGGRYSKTVRFNRGFTFNFRIHSASSRVEPSLKFAVSAISLPPSEIYTNHITF